MNTKSLKNFFEGELNKMFTLSEINFLFYIFAQKMLGFSKIQLIQFNQKEVLEADLQKFRTIVSELKSGRPYQYILGETEFYGSVFLLDENVLIPRPETEELVDMIIQSQRAKLGTKPLKILDIGSGSGCISVSLAKHLDIERVDALDISKKALEIAKKNAENNRVEINCIQRDYLKDSLEDVYDIIVSNPPYIDVLEEVEIEYSVKGHEPNLALFAPENHPLAFYQKIAEDCRKHLAPKGELYLEINQKLGKETQAFFEKVLSRVEVRKDLSGNDRFIVGAKR